MLLRKSLLVLTVVVSLVALTSGCATKSSDNLGELKTFASLGPYTVKPGDTLDVSVWGEPRLSGEVIIREDGRFTMPLIDDVDASGKTIKGLSEHLVKRLKEFVPGATVTVTMVQPGPTKYYLSGSFVKPGEFYSAESISFLQGIATGGGFAPFANQRSVVLIRKSSEGELRYELDYSAVISGEQPNPLLQSGDIIAVQ